MMNYLLYLRAMFFILQLLSGKHKIVATACGKKETIHVSSCKIAHFTNWPFQGWRTCCRIWYPFSCWSWGWPAIRKISLWEHWRLAKCFDSYVHFYLTHDESTSVIDNTLVSGELWMNLDGNISPVCINILPLVSTSQQRYNSSC